MKIVRFCHEGLEHTGFVESDVVYEGDADGGLKTYRLGDVKLLSPVKPSKAVCVGLNYKDHAQEMGEAPEPVLFIKPSTAVIGPCQWIVKPTCCERLDYEGELAVVIKDDIKNVTEQEAKKHILGYTCALDMTARDLQHKDGQWTRAKSFDTFLPIGPWIETDVDPAAGLELKLYVNDELKQSGNTKDMIFGVDKLVSFISSVMTLKGGDVILTGTPAGVGPVKPGDTIRFVIEGIGELENYVK